MLLLAGAVFLAAGVYLRTYRRSFRRRAVVVPGAVLELRAGGPTGVADMAAGMGMSTGVGPAEMYRPIVGFRTTDGRDVTASAPAGASKFLLGLRPGQPVRVYYDPNDPTQVDLDLPGVHGPLSVAMFGVGGCLTMLGLLVAAVGLLVFAASAAGTG